MHLDVFLSNEIENGYITWLLSVMLLLCYLKMVYMRIKHVCEQCLHQYNASHIIFRYIQTYFGIL